MCSERIFSHFLCIKLQGGRKYLFNLQSLQPGCGKLNFPSLAWGEALFWDLWQIRNTYSPHRVAIDITFDYKQQRCMTHRIFVTRRNFLKYRIFLTELVATRGPNCINYEKAAFPYELFCKRGQDLQSYDLYSIHTLFLSLFFRHVQTFFELLKNVFYHTFLITILNNLLKVGKKK